MNQQLSWSDTTERARAAVHRGTRDASRLGHNRITLPCLMLGLISDRENVASRLLSKLGVPLDSLYTDVERIALTTNPHDAAGTEKSAADTLRAVELAHAEAARLGNDYIETEQLLIGTLLARNRRLSAILRSHGVLTRLVRRELAEVWRTQGTD